MRPGDCAFTDEAEEAAAAEAAVDIMPFAELIMVVVMTMVVVVPATMRPRAYDHDTARVFNSQIFSLFFIFIFLTKEIFGIA